MEGNQQKHVPSDVPCNVVDLAVVRFWENKMCGAKGDWNASYEGARTACSDHEVRVKNATGLKMALDAFQQKTQQRVQAVAAEEHACPSTHHLPFAWRTQHLCDP